MRCPQCGHDVDDEGDGEPTHTCVAPGDLDTGDDVATVELPQPEPAAAASPDETQPIGFPPPATFDAPVTTPLVIVPADEIISSRAERTVELPTVFDGHGDLGEYPPPRETFRFRLVLVFALVAAVASVMASVADVIDIRTTRPASGIATGTSTLHDLGSNLGLAGFVGAAAAVIGGLLACFGLRWGAGLAGGAGLALTGWAAMTIGLAEQPIAIAESITRTSQESFTLRVTRDLGWWLVAGIGVVGVIVFLASLRSIAAAGRAALNPIIAAVTALAMLVTATGPLVPVGSARVADNFRSTSPDSVLPTAFFAGRLTQVGVLALAGVVGMLIVRAYGLGLAAGAVTVGATLWITSLLDLGDDPVGLAWANPGASSTTPHAVTTVGMVCSIALLIVAAVMATIRLRGAALRVPR